MISLMTGGVYCSLLQIFTVDELLTTGAVVIVLGCIYVKAHIKEIRNKKVEKEFKKKELERKKQSITDIKNVNTNKLFI